MITYYKSWQFWTAIGLSMLMALLVIWTFHIQALWLVGVVGIGCSLAIGLPLYRSYNREKQEDPDDYDW